MLTQDIENQMESKPLVNRVANSALEVFNLEDLFPAGKVNFFDIKDFLFQGLLLREKEFRATLKELDWEVYRGSYVALYCTADAIVPTWAYMLVGVYLRGVDAEVHHCRQEEFIHRYYTHKLAQQDWAFYEGKRVVIKGCSKHPVPESAYVRAAAHLQPYAQSIMFGEPCSTVPLFKRPRKLD